MATRNVEILFLLRYKRFAQPHCKIIYDCKKTSNANQPRNKGELGPFHTRSLGQKNVSKVKDETKALLKASNFKLQCLFSLNMWLKRCPAIALQSPCKIYLPESWENWRATTRNESKLTNYDMGGTNMTEPLSLFLFHSYIILGHCITNIHMLDSSIK